jgi:hypothetical protein
MARIRLQIMSWFSSSSKEANSDMILKAFLSEVEQITKADHNACHALRRTELMSHRK